MCCSQSPLLHNSGVDADLVEGKAQLLAKPQATGARRPAHGEVALELRVLSTLLTYESASHGTTAYW